MVASQAALAGAVGYGIGLGLCAIGGELLIRADMPFRLMWYTPLVVGSVIVAICIMAALISGRKVLQTDAAIVFKA
jgi:putative ABC transport system permease protein